MLTRNSQVGEFYVLQPPQVDPTDGGATPAKAKFTSDILIYDEESDRHVRITWGQAVEACCIAAGPGTAGKINGAAVRMSHPTTGPQGMDNGGAQGRDYARDGGQLPNQLSLAAWLTKAKVIQSFNEQRIVEGSGQAATATYGQIDTDIRIVIARPFIEHLMHSVIMAVSGRDTGATLFGPADMQLSANTQVKTIEGHCKSSGRSNPSPLPAQAS
jgi:hypothetical protein